jgi:N-acetylated-alpha-linked acidic dipeptidase
VAPMLDYARTAPIDAAYLRHVVERLVSIGSSPLGFRATGTPEDRAVADFVAGEMRDIGLAGVALETVPVDGWRLHDARVAVTGGAEYACASMGGAPPTAQGGVVAPLVDVGAGERRRLDRLDIAGRVALLDWRSAKLAPSDIGLELGRRGAVGIILNCPEGGPFYQSPRALGSFGSHWFAGAPPFVSMCKEDAVEVRAANGARGLEVRLTLDAELTHGAPGCNVVGYLPGDEPGGPIVVGAHHDGWFSAAFDNATGVAATLALARALIASGRRPRHTICFTSRTGEEYGLTDSAYGWCTGAWAQISDTHPEWGAGVPFHLNLEASGHPELRLLIEAPREHTRWARRLARAGAAEGWLTSGWYTLGPPVTGTEAWPFLVSGVPGVSAYTWERSFMRTDYHTQYDTAGLVDFAHLERLCRFYTYLLLSADADPGGILDHRDRARELAAVAARLGASGAGLAEAARTHAAVRGRAAFTPLGRGLCAVDAHGGTGYPHVQAARDAALLEAALAALGRGDRRAAVRTLARVGANALARTLSQETFERSRERRRAEHPRSAWGGASHPTASPLLWQELASLRGEPGSREPGDWIEQSLQGHLKASRADLARRLAAMQAALAASARA